jgi:HB1, ASXL, restriction endonuclease HTH domain
MTYYEAALQVLRAARRPLTTQEIADQALEQGLIAPNGKTPHGTMRAKLYLALRSDTALVKLEESTNGRARRGSVRWTLRPGPRPRQGQRAEPNPRKTT